MRIICIVALLCTFGCSQPDAPKETGTTRQQGSSVRTLDNLIHFDAVSAGYQHPLVCGPGGDSPAGQELTFKNAESKDFVHAVFPEEVTAPDELQGNFVLHGHFQSIQNRTRYAGKKPPEDYRYFVVSSWEHEKQEEISNNRMEGSSK